MLSLWSPVHGPEWLKASDSPAIGANYTCSNPETWQICDAARFEILWCLQTLATTDFLKSHPIEAQVTLVASPRFEPSLRHSER